jgi:hypothetical protein
VALIAGGPTPCGRRASASERSAKRGGRDYEITTIGPEAYLARVAPEVAFADAAEADHAATHVNAMALEPGSDSPVLSIRSAEPPISSPGGYARPSIPR